MSSVSRVPLASLLREEVVSLEEYVPIVPVEVLSQQYGVPPERVIKLDGNENPYGCSPRVLHALGSWNWYHHYPDPEHREARAALAQYVRVSTEYLLLGNGSDELIDLVVRAAVAPGDEVITCVPTFDMYRFYGALAGARVISVSRDGSYGLDLAAVREQLSACTKIIFVATPNNPTGNTVDLEALREMLSWGPLVVVDEAYYEFCEKTVAPWVPDYDNLVVLRTFSKWAGLAGLRVGYGVFPLPLVKELWKIKTPYNVNEAALVAVRESLSDLALLQERVQALVQERGRLLKALRSIPFLRPYPSEANFVFCLVVGRPARRVKEGLARRGIFVRYFDTPLLREALRISVGKPAHTKALIQALREMEEDGD